MKALQLGSRQPLDAFIERFEKALTGGTFVSLVLGGPRSADADLLRVTARLVDLQGEAKLSLVSSHKTRDLTENSSGSEASPRIRAWMTDAFRTAHLHTTTDDLQWLSNKRGTQTLLRGPPSRVAAVPAHDRAKHRFVAIERPFLAELGVTDAQSRLVPAMARKWKQINKFIEVFDGALKAARPSAGQRLDVVDFGSGKGYLTFALHDHLRHTLGLPVQVTGVELRPDMVELCNGVVQRLGLEGIGFEQGDVRTVVPESIDVMIALHACDTATDFAMATGVRAGAQIIMCSPCCHKELRPQLLSPHPLRPILKHGVHLGQQAEMLTDGLRALLLEAHGYDTQVFEFVALEHTSKNKMILAVKRSAAKPPAEIWAQIDEVKRFYGVRELCLEMLLKQRDPERA